MQPQKKDVKPKPATALDKIKAWVSPGATAGILRDAEKKRQEILKQSGA